MNINGDARPNVLMLDMEGSSSALWVKDASGGLRNCLDYSEFRIPNWLLRRIQYWDDWYESRVPERAQEMADWEDFNAYGLSIAVDLKRAVGNTYAVYFGPEKEITLGEFTDSTGSSSSEKSCRYNIGQVSASCSQCDWSIDHEASDPLTCPQCGAPFARPVNIKVGIEQVSIGSRKSNVLVLNNHSREYTVSESDLPDIILFALRHWEGPTRDVMTKLIEVARTN